MVRAGTAILIGAGLLAAAPARAQDMVNVYLMDGGAFNNALNASTIVSRTKALLGNKAEPASKPVPRAAPAKALQFTSTPEATAIPAMAAAYPAAKRGEVAGVFRQLLGKFCAIEKMFGQPHNDLPTALALYVATSYEAVTGVEVKPDQARPLIAQMRTLLQGGTGIAGASDAEKQKLYEMFAVTGMFTATAGMELKRKPDPAASARLKASGRANLARLGLDPDRMRFGAEGLSSR
ncbi:hypothetical protein J2W22_003813 [Sphingomonas kyeonggiensis]|uniref:DUF6683 family protein n=1 Tax=Sphingomonas kyeonggiensis TaxID=1268553 RepID=UPI00278B4F83|nr:DUF6683 family protein [Sphingomonas kyeonggiensis]MDQ0251725.1 hypothetical protein [Sphingomonas kyeonggiensis]